MPGWSWRPAAGSATEGTRPSQPTRAGRTETRRALQAAAPGARTAPIMKGGGPPVRPANRPFDRRPGKTGQNHPVRRGLTQGCRRSDRRQADNKTAPLPDPGRRSKGVKSIMTPGPPAPPAERPHGPGNPPIESPFMTIFSRSQDLRKLWQLAVKRLNYMKTAITSNVTAFASFRIRAPRARTPAIFSNGAPGRRRPGNGS